MSLETAIKSSFGRLNEVQTYARDSANFNNWWDSENALFLKVFSGEVLTAFKRAAVFRDLVMTKTIPSGKSTTFPRMGRAVGRYHLPGTSVLGNGNRIQESERIIYVDDLFLADTFVYELDELKSSFQHRAKYAVELGEALARQFDRTVIRSLFKAAADTGSLEDNWNRNVEAVTVSSASESAGTITLSGNPSGNVAAGKVIYARMIDGSTFSATVSSVSTVTVTLAKGSYPPQRLGDLETGAAPWTLGKLDVGTSITSINDTSADALVAAFFSARQKLMEKDVTGNLYMVTTPDVYFKLVQSSRAINADFNSGSNNGSYADGNILRIAGMPVRVSNNLRALASEGNQTKQVGERNDYVIDMTKALAIVFHESAVGAAVLKGIESQVSGNDVSVMYQGSVLVSRMVAGVGVLRPEAACSLFAA